MNVDYDSLTEKQKRFIDFYVQTGNASEACRMAGYNAKNYDKLGYENKVKLGKFIDEKLKAKADERIATEDEILRYLTSVMRGEITEECIAVEGVGKGFSQVVKIRKEVSPKDRNKATEILSKIYGLDKAKATEVPQNDDGFIQALNTEAERVWDDED